MVGVRAGNDSGQWSSWTNSAPIGPFTPEPTPVPKPTPTPSPAPTPTPPDTPASVTVTRADGTITASGYAVSGAAKYHVTYSSDGMQSWTAAASPANNYSANSITITGADNAKTYVVGVRAGNDTGQWSGWRNSSPIGPFTPEPTPTPTPTLEPTPTPTPTPAPAPPDAPASVTVTRADGTITASGYAASGAAKYHVTYRSDGEQSWTAASDSHTGNSITITGVDNAKTYVIGVRAGNAGDWSVWTNSEAAGPYTPPPSAPANLSVTPGDGYLDIAWDAVSEATGYDMRAKTAGASDWHDVASNATGTSHRYTTIETMDYVAVRARSPAGASAWSQVSRLPPSELLNTATGIAAQSGGPVMAAAQSGGAIG